MSADWSSSPLPKVETIRSPSRLFTKGNRKEMETSDLHAIEQHPDTSPAEQRDSSTPTPGHSGSSGYPSTPPSMPSAETRRGRQATREDGDQEPEDEEVESAELPDPQDRINDFDWEDLQEKYHDMIKERGNTEQELYEEFTNLINFFTIWANTTSAHEVDRSFKRLKTRIHHVQHSEEQLEQKRQHYILVVNAFKSALSLLNGP